MHHPPHMPTPYREHARVGAEHSEEVYCRVRTSKEDCRSSSVVKLFDRLGGAEPLLNKGPEEWLRLCHARADCLRSVQVTQLRSRPSVEALARQGLTPAQVERNLYSREEALRRRQFITQWQASMPPTIRQSYGIHGQPLHGIRIPLPP